VANDKNVPDAGDARLQPTYNYAVVKYLKTDLRVTTFSSLTSYESFPVSANVLEEDNTEMNTLPYSHS
jgi:hypothetical protein